LSHPITGRIAIVILAAALAVACGRPDPVCGTSPGAGVHLDLENPICENLSAFRLFRGVDDRGLPVPNEGVVPYALTSELFSDYAGKLRTVWIPEDAGPAGYEADRAFTFPVGTIISKTFYVPEDRRDPNSRVHLVETRLLIHLPSGWSAMPYVWDEAQTDAVATRLGQRNIALEWTHDDGTTRATDGYMVPDRIECSACHKPFGDVEPVGPAARFLNRDLVYDDVGPRNQLVRWTELGLLEGAPAPEDAPRVAAAFEPGSGTLDERARAYLDVNCASCHNPTSGVRGSGLDLRIETDDTGKLGVCKTPSAAGGEGSGGRPYDIVPGDPDDSIMAYRLEADLSLPNATMPPLGRSLPHDEGVALIREWITWLGTADALTRYPRLAEQHCWPGDGD
jgi:uncharacterized repeat protein (TIGR03806 family)